MKIIVTESTYKKALELSETAGVPSNIYETSVYLYDLLTRQLPPSELSYDSQKSRYVIVVLGNFIIGDYKFHRVNFNIVLSNRYNTSELFLARLAVNRQSELEDFKLKNIKTDTLDILIEFGLAQTTKKEDAFNYIINNEKDIIRGLSHELKHYYDHYVKPYMNIIKSAQYSSYMEPIGQEIIPLNEFFYYVYYIQEVENTVRPSEFYTDFKLSNIDKKGFLDFLKKNQMYTILKNISSWNPEKMKNDLKLYMNNINDLLKSIHHPIINGTDEEKINELLRITFFTLSGRQARKLKDMLATSPFELFIGLSPDKERFIQKYMEKLRLKYEKDPLQFYKDEEIHMKKTTNKLIRKLAKTYVLAKDSE